ncbi:16S rRNA (guanine(527)-N(7))-methyltransferase RsmG [Frigidibacter sp. ROC022]|uniref:16S rRNA (guanine(527)-N(7))-methyltransferase RsmG n=1 Tax=Frigidibacter sp. ROC022 TaxID=2971796 RepID=UPI00215A9798|nr:16S rRNA (guanine(527)-N(7))-methyltransferase RsmG [Frigidibacter sp. ROC022]MCR8724469.1 16S rRNA (guanine(527)-N(7))-methyltransferase RsmG [Frigidibacter sp. ROC022]
MPEVSRETTERLAAFEALVRKWNPAVNLVSRASLADLRQRHIEDSVQLLGFSGLTAGHWVDLGTGGGFPGLVIAILAMDLPNLRVTCIESDNRKAAFLATVVRELGLPATILAERIEAAPPQQGDVVSARALAPLGELLPLALRHLQPGGMAIFPKGARYATEVAAAREAWRFDLTEAPSRTDLDARLLKLEGLTRA